MALLQNKILLTVESTYKSCYFLFLNDTLISNGQLNIGENNINSDFNLCSVNKLRFYCIGNSVNIKITHTRLDDFDMDYVWLNSVFYPVPNIVEEPEISFSPGSSPDRSGFTELIFPGEYVSWYFNWMDTEWNNIFQRH